MNLKDFFANRSDREKKLYWALVLEPGWIQAGVWEITDDTANVVSVSPPTHWEAEADISEAADAVISSAVANFPDDFKEPSETVFGVCSSWVVDGQIAEEHLRKIKKICNDLSLSPVGFVVLGEAIAHLFKSEEGSPLSGVVMGVSETDLEISLFKLGDLGGSSKIARSISLVDDIVEGLTRFKSASPFPSRFIIYDGKEGSLEEERQEILAASWDSVSPDIKFLHTPKVEIVAPERKVIAAALAGASEIANVSQVSTIKDDSEEEVAGKDEISASAEEIQNVTAPETPDANITAEELGFVVNGDISRKSVEPQQTVQLPVQEPARPQAPLGQPSQTSPASGLQPKKVIQNIFSKFKLPAFKKPQSVSIKLPDYSGARVFIFAGIILAVLGIGLTVFWWFYTTAVVTLHVSPQIFETDTEVTVSASGPTDFVSITISGKLATSEETGEKSKSTTGTKLVGDKATGTVKIENGTTNSLNLPAGTSIKSANDLVFTTKQTASVSAALSPSSPGTATVDIVASNIGGEYNLASGEVFKISNYPKSEIDAIATADFSGGSSRQVAAVSSDDQRTLLTDLTNDLQAKVADKLRAEITDSQILIENTTASGVTSKSYSAKVGDEASNLKLNLTVSAGGLVIAKEDLLTVIKEVSKEKIPAGYAVRDEQITPGFTLLKKDGDKYLYSVHFSINLLPEISVSKISKNISGKYPKDAEKYFIDNVPGYRFAEVNFKYNLPGILGVLPETSKNITIEIAAEK